MCFPNKKQQKKKGVGGSVKYLARSLSNHRCKQRADERINASIQFMENNALIKLSRSLALQAFKKEVKSKCRMCVSRRAVRRKHMEDVAAVKKLHSRKGLTLMQLPSTTVRLYRSSH